MRSIGLLLLISVAAFGQRAGTARPAGVSTFGSASGFGNVVFPGTGHAPIANRPINGVGIGSRTGAPVPTRFRTGTSVVYVPYGVPLYVGQPEQPPVTIMYPTQQMAPQVVINQNFAPEVAWPVVREYVSDSEGGVRVYEPPPAASSPAPTEENRTYLIAFKDHTIYAAIAYWVEGDTLHYVTNQNTHNQVSLDLIDRELSMRFNRERNVDFQLPPAR